MTKPNALATKVQVTQTFLKVTLADGRKIAVPITWFPRLKKATATQRRKWRLIGGGLGIHWEELDEDISVPALLKNWVTTSDTRGARRLVPRLGIITDCKRIEWPPST